MKFYLENDGDDFEKQYNGLFIKKEFSHYEIFWQNFITPITNRPKNVQLRSDDELKKIGRGDEDICIAQLHYTVLINLIRVYDLRHVYPLNYDQFIEGITRICSAIDVADELLQRYSKKGVYNPMSESDFSQNYHKLRILKFFVLLGKV